MQSLNTDSDYVYWATHDALIDLISEASEDQLTSWLARYGYSLRYVDWAHAEPTWEVEQARKFLKGDFCHRRNAIDFASRHLRDNACPDELYEALLDVMMS